MPKPKKPHPAELAAENDMISAVRSADHFMASLFRGAGRYDKAIAPTVAGAIREGNRIEGLAGGTRRSMIYAIGKDGRATFLTNALIQRMAQAFEQQRKS